MTEDLVTCVVLTRGEINNIIGPVEWRQIEHADVACQLVNDKWVVMKNRFDPTDPKPPLVDRKSVIGYLYTFIDSSRRD